MAILGLLLLSLLLKPYLSSASGPGPKLEGSIVNGIYLAGSEPREVNFYSTGRLRIVCTFSSNYTVEGTWYKNDVVYRGGR